MGSWIFFQPRLHAIEEQLRFSFGELERLKRIHKTNDQWMNESDMNLTTIWLTFKYFHPEWIKCKLWFYCCNERRKTQRRRFMKKWSVAIKYELLHKKSGVILKLLQHNWMTQKKKVQHIWILTAEIERQKYRSSSSGRWRNHQHPIMNDQTWWTQSINLMWQVVFKSTELQ